MTWSSFHHVMTPSPAPSRSHRSQCVGGARGIMQGEPGVGVRGLESLTLPSRQEPVRPSPHISLTRSPILLAHEAPREGLVEHQALLHGPTGGLHDLLYRPDRRAKHGSHLLLRRRIRGPRLLVTLHPWMEERRLHLLSSLLCSGAQPPPMPLPRAPR